MTHKIDTCCHYWIIPEASGPTTIGVCKYCGKEKEFMNSWPGLHVINKLRTKAYREALYKKKKAEMEGDW